MRPDKNIEDILKSKFSKNNLENEHLPIPGDHVWANIQENLPGEKKRKFLPIWFGAIVFIGVISALLYWSIKPAQQVNFVQPNFETSMPTHNSLLNNTLGTSQIEIDQTIETEVTSRTEPASIDKSFDYQKNTERFVRTEKDLAPQSIVENSITAFNRQKEELSSGINEGIQLTKKQGDQIIKKDPIVVTISKVPSLPIDGIASMTTTDVSPSDLILDQNIHSSQKMKNAAVQLTSTFGESYTSTIYSFGDDENAQSFSTNGASFRSAHIEYQIPIKSRWIFSLGIGLTTIHFDGNYDLISTLEASNNQADNKSSIKAQLPSYSGIIDAEIFLEPTSSNITSAEVVETDLSLAHGVNSVDITMGIIHEIPISSKLNLNIFGNLGYSIRRGSLETFDSQILIDNTNFTNPSLVVNSISSNETLRQNMIRAGLRLDVTTPITEVLEVGLSSQFYKYLNTQNQNTPFDIGLSTFSVGPNIRLSF